MPSERIKFTRIKSAFSEARRLPRLGKIRLGKKVQSARTGKEYPVETEYFVCPPEVQEVYGEQPIELDVMFPLDDPEEVFVQKLAFYGSSSGLKCHGNGEEALEFDEKTKDWKPRLCPCERLDKGECGEQSHLMVLLPKVSMGGCYQITTGSYHSTVAVNSSLDYIRAMAGRIAMIPMKLKRVPQEMTHEGKKRTHYTLSLVLDANLAQIAELRSNPAGLLIPAQYRIEGPAEINPKLDPVDLVIDDKNQVDAQDLADADEDAQEAIRQKLAERQAEKPPDPKKAEPKKAAPKQEVPKVEPTASVPDIEEATWVDTINAIDDDPDLRDIKEQIKAKYKLPSLHYGKLTPHGRHGFLKHFKAAAMEAGFGGKLKQLFNEAVA